MYQGCIFDLDGTLLNTVESLALSTNLTIAKYGLGPLSTELFYHFVGDGYKKQLERALLKAGDCKLVHYEEALVDYKPVFEENCLYEVKPYDGIMEVIAYLKENSFKIAVFSNKPHERTADMMDAIFGRDCFDIVLGQKEGTPTKPDPAGALLVASSMGVKPEDCLYIGDTNTDMQTGKNAGMDTAGAIWGFRGREELEAYAPAYLLEKPLDLLEVLKKAKEH